MAEPHKCEPIGRRHRPPSPDFCPNRNGRKNLKPTWPKFGQRCEWKKNLGSLPGVRLGVQQIGNIVKLAGNVGLSQFT